MRAHSFVTLGLLALLGVPLVAAAAVQSNQPGYSSYQGLHWRLVGPFRGGWATMAAGVPDQPNTFYFGAADGGVWKTTDAGRTWHPLMQHEGSASVGALAIAPSNPNVIYVGTGQVAARYDIAGGDGVYKSTDGGRTWTHVGLADTRHIGRIVIDPHNSNRVLVAALGHIFGPNAERGVFLTTDGGKTWEKTLFINDDTGAVDLASDPAHPSVVYAAAWQMRMRPWLDYFQPQAGPGSGIYKSTDGGETWHKLSGHGLPAGKLGRIGLAVKGNIVYATIVASGTIGADNMMSGGGSGLYRSDDGGAHWQLANTDPELVSDYFSRVTVAPNDANTVFVIGRSIHESTDGGKHFAIIKGAPGGDDYHFLWINPKYPDHWITAADQGCVVTVNGGKTWSSWYNQPTGQFYHVATDNQFPYRIYGGQQDSGTVSIASRGPNGVIGPREWNPVGGDERDFDIPKPGNPGLVFGSGLGGYVSRWSAPTHQVTDVSPWPVSSYGADPRTVKYRYTWLTPLAFGGGKTHPLYFGAQVLFRSEDDGANWKIVSPDLSGANANAKNCATAQNSLANAKDCGFGVIFSIAPSPLSDGTIWTGSDDGEVELTTDGGAHWQNVTPPAMPLWGKVNDIGPSPFNANAAWVAVDTHRLGEEYPLIFRTSDGGAHWQKIVTGLPTDEFVQTVVADSVRRGLLFAGTDRSVYVSFDFGNNWQPLGLNLPTTSVRSLTIHGADLIAATMGRGFWSLDDIEPLREVSNAILASPAYLFTPEAAIRLRGSENQDTPPPPSEPRAKNPPAGAIIDYWLKDKANGPVTLTITDSAGHVVRQFSSAAKPEQLKANRYFQPGWVGAPKTLSATAGMHRFVWNLRWPRPPAITYHYSISAVFPGDTPLVPQGALALPGKYTVTLAADGHRYSVPLTVQLDPRINVLPQDLTANLALENRISGDLARAITAYDALGGELAKLRAQAPAPATRIAALESLSENGENSFAGIAGVLDTLATKLEMADAAPTAGQRAVYAAYGKKLDALLARWKQMQAAASAASS